MAISGAVSLDDAYSDTYTSISTNGTTLFSNIISRRDNAYSEMIIRVALVLLQKGQSITISAESTHNVGKEAMKISGIYVHN